MSRGLFFTAILLLTCSGWADGITWTDHDTGITWEYTVVEKKASLTGAKTNDGPIAGDVCIPAAVGGFSVTSISNYAFDFCEELTAVTIPSGVQSIGDSAFSNCTGLKSVTIPSGVDSIGQYAFSHCAGLKSVTIPSTVKDMQWSAFWGCGGMISYCVENENQNYKSVNGLLLTKDGQYLIAGVNGDVVIPDGVIRIAGAFYGCSGLTSVMIPSSVHEIDSYSFCGCSSLLSVTIPNVSRIADSTFAGCSGLTSVMIPSGVQRVGSGAFSECSGLKTVTIASSVQSIDLGAFYGCCGMTCYSVDDGNCEYKSVDGLLLTKDGKILIAGVNGDVVIPDGVTTIRARAFSDCIGLESVIIPSSVKDIDSGAFSGCSGLTEVVIPDGVTSIGFSAFELCKGLTTLRIPSSASVSSPVSTFLGCNSLKDVTLPGWSRGIDLSSVTNLVISEGTTSIEYAAFADCHALASVSIPSSVISIGERSFEYCGLTSVVIPAGVKTIGRRAFLCNSLENVIMEGDAPTAYDSSFGDWRELYVVKGTKGWDSDGDGYWNGLKIHWVEKSSNLLFETGNDGWFLQTNMTISGDCAWQSACVTNRGVSSLVGKVYGQGKLSFKWKRQMSSSGKLRFSVDGVQVGDDLTENIDWTSVEIDVIGVSQHTFEWRYIAARGDVVQNDAGWVDSIVWKSDVDKTLHVIYDLGSGGVSTNGCELVQYVAFGTFVNAPQFSLRDGWSWSGWDRDVVFVTNDVVVKAVYEPIVYSIKYDLGGVECNNTANPTTYTVTNKIVFVEPVDYDYSLFSFSGWDPMTLNDWIQSVGDIVVKAMWTQAPPVIDIDDEGSIEGQFGEVVHLSNHNNVTNGLTNIFCVGWTGMGCVPSEGRSNDVDVVLSCRGAIHWLYQTNVCLKASSENGVISPNSSWYDLADNAVVEVCFVPDDGYQLYAWNVDGVEQEPAFETEMQLVKMDGAHEVGVVTRNIARVNANVDGSSAIWDKTSNQLYRSGYITNNQRSDMSLDVEGPASCTFDWAVSSEDGYDYLYCYVDDQPSVAKITGVQDWMAMKVDVEEGRHTIRWSFKKDEVDEDPIGQDCGWVRNIKLAGRSYEYAVKFNAGDHGTIPSGDVLQQVYWGGNAQMPKVTAEEGWCFLGWLGSPSNITGNIELRARYICNGFPDLGDTPSEKMIQDVIEGSADSELAKQIDAENYQDFCRWSKIVKRSDETAVAGEREVKSSQNAWLSFALGSEKLIDKAPTNGQVRVDGFRPAITEGTFEFTVSIDGIEVGKDASKENLKKVFGLEGGKSPSEMSANNVDIIFGTPENGRVKFTAVPNGDNADAKSFFMKVKMTP